MLNLIILFTCIILTESIALYSVKKYSNDTIYTSKKIEKIKKNSNIERYNNIVNKLDINKYKKMKDGFIKIYR